MNKKVTELTEATSINNNDLFMIIQNGENKKVILDKILKKVIEGKNMITVGLEVDTALTSTTNYQTFDLALTKEMFRKGTLLTTNSTGGIIIPAGVSKILVSANCLSVGTVGTYGIIISKNEIQTSSAFTVPISETYSNISLTPIGIDVTEGDIISLGYYINNSGITRTVRASSGYGTYLTIEVIE